MYSPFTDRKEKMKPISKVVFKDILQLELKQIEDNKGAFC